MADRFLAHAEFGYRVVGFVDDTGDDHIGYRGLPLLGPLDDTEEVLQRERIDQLYVALPIEKHLEMLQLVEVANRECVDVHIIPDFLQFVTPARPAGRPRRHPVINVNDVPLRGFNAVVKRLMDLAVSAGALLVLALPFAAIARGHPLHVARPRLLPAGTHGASTAGPSWCSSSAPCSNDAERDTGPVWTRENDPRRTPVGRFLRRFSLDELPQLWNVFKGEMSLVGPRPERPYFVERFKESVPQYMLRHKVKAGLTGWAQVNGWRGNTSIEKRIEYDLYYIENWSSRPRRQDHLAHAAPRLLPAARLLGACAAETRHGAIRVSADSRRDRKVAPGSPPGRPPSHHATRRHHRSRRLHRLAPSPMRCSTAATRWSGSTTS